ncbi:hypothetical protein [Rhodospirillaceae bacterium SYSU D60014]|uniref:hypothetical protein n=1 Tax=Virgifigura deserti TaxID=2268457 RepID=UPI000E6681FD
MATRDLGSGGAGSDPSKSTTGTSSAAQAESGSTAGAGTELRDETRRLTEQAKERAQSYASERKEMAAKQVGGVAQALRSAADNLKQQDQPYQQYAANYITRAADSLDQFSNALRDRDFGSLASQARDMARQQPGLLIGGSAIAGFLVARFARASAEHSKSRHGSYGNSDYSGTAGTDRLGAGGTQGDTADGSIHGSSATVGTAGVGGAPGTTASSSGGRSSEGGTR